MTVKGYVTLAVLADRYGCAQATLRQRIRRGTLKATKVGTLWLVAQREADRLVSSKHGTAP